ncbi:hypothetical protein, partial [Clostridium sp. ATCC 29733]|uniref:hypothetical protein n=1 Tax=Clostridium sp. (strain ATCC 29733 / VPI C48-50) TaxID=1507 RepID=UPI001A98836B
ERNTPLAQTCGLYSGYFAPAGSLYHSLQGCRRRCDTEKIAVQFSLAAPPSNAVGTAAAGKPVAK